MDEKQIAALREAFEQAVRELFPFSYAVHGFELRDDGKYRHGFIREAWTVWLACYQHLAPMVEDAERFRWLLDGNGYFMEECGLCGYAPCTDKEKDDARETIDAAREQEKKTC